MTPTDIKAALTETNWQLDDDPEYFRMPIKHLKTFKTALALAERVMEPSYEITEAGWEAFRDSNKPAPFNQLKDGFKAMIEQACLEIKEEKNA